MQQSRVLDWVAETIGSALFGGVFYILHRRIGTPLYFCLCITDSKAFHAEGLKTQYFSGPSAVPVVIEDKCKIMVDQNKKMTYYISML